MIQQRKETSEILELKWEIEVYQDWDDLLEPPKLNIPVYMELYIFNL